MDPATDALTSERAVRGLWPAGATAPDTHVAFRGAFALAAAGPVAIEILAASWWEAHCDGRWLDEGAPRYHPSQPEHLRVELTLGAGEHVLAIHAHHYGVHTRLQRDLPPFVRVQVRSADALLPVAWRCLHLACYHAQVARINPQLGWIDWLDTRAEPATWREPGFDDRLWAVPEPSLEVLPASRPAAIRLPPRAVMALNPIAQGELHEAFGYERDDPGVRFLLRALDARLPAQGLWRRYDLGRVRLGRPDFELDLPPGAVVEWAMAEQLRDGRVTPFITLSAGHSCNLDHIVARGGQQRFTATAAKGGRYLELHILCQPSRIRILSEGFAERCYFQKQLGSLSSHDGRLDAIWQLGVETLRACSEDAVCDNPTRERGQWTGDALIALETAAVAFGDCALGRRALQQAAIDARPDGLVSGLSPADSLGVTTYAMQWVGACLRYHELTGDLALLHELHPAAIRNLQALSAGAGADGLGDTVGWGFVDWGYARPPAPVDLALNLHFLAALRAMTTWCGRVTDGDGAERHRAQAVALTRTIRTHLAGIVGGPARAWAKAGYHVVALALRYEVLDPGQVPGAIAYLQGHLLACFPNDPTAPRLSDPGVSESRLITPYFAHYALAALAEAGHMDFVLEQYRRCWGWMLEQGATTCLEVFDPRWSHCHQWAACPTWQMSRYLLGIDHCFQYGHNHLVLRRPLGSLPAAAGVVLVSGGAVEVSWRRAEEAIELSVTASTAVVLHIGERQQLVEGMFLLRFNGT